MAAEWEGLNEVLGRRAKPATQKALAKAIRARNAELCERIRAGDAESTTEAGQLFEHVRQTVAAKLRVSDPALLERDGAG